MESKYYFVFLNFIDYGEDAQADLQGQFVHFSALILVRNRGPPTARIFESSS